MAWKDAAIQAGADNNNESKISTESNKEQN
jgi:hypothetical protein